VLTVCRREGEGIQELAHRTGHGASVAATERNEWGGRAASAMEGASRNSSSGGLNRGRNESRTCPQKGVALRKRLLARSDLAASQKTAALTRRPEMIAA